MGVVIAQHPDAVVVATGAEPVVPRIPGLENVEHATGHQVLSGERAVGVRVLIIGGGMIGMETAEFLAGQGKTVTVVEMLGEIARDMEPITRALLLKRCANLSVELFTDTVVRRFEEHHVVIESHGHESRLSGFDSVILAVGTKSVDTLSSSLRERGYEVYTAGDSRSPRHLLDAIREGFEVGLAV